MAWRCTVALQYRMLAVGALVALLPVSPAVAAARPTPKPNLLFIWTDQQRADTMAAYGNDRIHAPNLNRLANESVVFQRAYVTQPVCTPSRSSVLTGLWPHTSGCTTNNIRLPENVPCLPELVNDSDYRTAYMGKWHLGDEIFPQHGFQEMVSIEDGYLKYYSSRRDRDRRSDYHQFLLSKGYRPDLENNMFSREFAARLPIEHCKPRFLETRACEFLRTHRDRPFILYVNFLEPHAPYLGPLDDEHGSDEVYVPRNFLAPLEANEPLRYRVLREFWQDRSTGDEDSARGLIRRYWGLVTQVDRSVGEILRTVDTLGLRENTIVVFTSDHGDMMGSHGLLAKTVMYEEAVRVPWLLRVPGATARRLIDRPVSHIDLVPTLLELMRIPLPQQFPGRSLLPLISGEPAREDHVFIEWNPGTGTEEVAGGTRLASADEIARAGQAHIRTVISPDNWKLCLSDLDKSQLFNLNADPAETRNLFDSGLHRDVINRLTERVHRWQAATGDTVRLPGLESR